MILQRNSVTPDGSASRAHHFLSELKSSKINDLPLRATVVQTLVLVSTIVNIGIIIVVTTNLTISLDRDL